MKEKNRETLIEKAVESLMEQFPAGTDNVFIKEYKISGKINALKEMLKKKLFAASKDKGSVSLISTSGTLWSDLYYLLNEIGIDYRHVQLTKVITLDFFTKTLEVVER